MKLAVRHSKPSGATSNLLNHFHGTMMPEQCYHFHISYGLLPRIWVASLDRVYVPNASPPTSVYESHREPTLDRFCTCGMISEDRVYLLISFIV